MRCLSRPNRRLPRRRGGPLEGALAQWGIRAPCGLFGERGPRPWRERSSVECTASPRVLFAPSPLGRGPGGDEGVEPAVAFADRFQLAVEEWGSTLYLRLMGELDVGAVGRLQNELDRVFEAYPTRRVVFDLQLLTFLDAAGLGTILRANEAARAGAFELIVVRPRGFANRIFTLTRAGDELSMVDQGEVRA
jgi:anti-anti-sigma factor